MPEEGSPCLSIDVRPGRRVRRARTTANAWSWPEDGLGGEADLSTALRFGGNDGLWRMKEDCLRLSSEVVEQGLHFAGGVDVLRALSGGEALFQARDGFFCAA
jgi:hypothetical protein